MNHCQPNLIFDIGLHLGEDTDYYLKKGFDVVAFEANPDLVAHCRARFSDDIAQGRLRIVEGAIASAAHGDTLTFYVNKDSSVWGTVEVDWVQRNQRLGTQSESITVPRVDMAEAYRSFGVPHYMKIDIEGADRIALDALRDFVARPKYISIESEKVRFDELRGEFELFRGLGYGKFKPVQQSEIPGSIIRTRTLDGREFEHRFESYASGAFGEDISQPWLGMDEALREYEAIFRRYRQFGDDSPLMRYPMFIRSAAKVAYRLRTGYRGQLPGWYDTHASL